MFSLRQLKIGYRIMAGMPVIVFPAFLLGYFLISEKGELINFTNKEIAGIHYLRAAQNALVAEISLHFDKNQLMKAAEQLKDAESKDDGRLGVTKRTEELLALMRKTETVKDVKALVDRTSGLISAIADNSNITLDPDTDSYFVGDLLVNQITGLLKGTAELVHTAHGAVMPSSGIDEKIAFAEARDGLTSTSDTFSSELTKAIKGSGTDILGKSLEKDGHDIAQSIESLIDAAKDTNSSTLDTAAAGLISDLSSYISKCDDQMERLLNVRNSGFYWTLKLRLAIGLISLLLGGFVFFVIIRSILQPLKQLSVDLGRLAEGDYINDLEGAELGDEIAAMIGSLNTSVRKTRDIVSQIRVSAQAVNSAANEIATGSSDLSMRTEQQASNLEETAASMEEITGTVHQNSQNANTANELSSKANLVAGNGGQVVEAAVKAMGTIEKSFQRISDIIGVIDEIAFQTNLLALNAAVEAARAGDAGKGFAVVASEVRSLAGRSASASKEIKALILGSAVQVKDGAELVNQSGAILKEILTSIRQVATIVSEIASASTQQATGISEINSAVTQMDEVTQQNAALVEQNTAATQSMLEQARNLETLIDFFKVEITTQTGEETDSLIARSELPRADGVITPARSGLGREMPSRSVH